MNVSKVDLNELTKQAKALVRANQYKISFHALYDNPQRNITAADILQVLKEGAIKQLEPREVADRLNTSALIVSDGSEKMRVTAF